MPHFLHRLDIERKRLRERRLGKTRGNPDPQRPRCHLEQGKAFVGIEAVEHRGQHSGRIRSRQCRQPINRLRDAEWLGIRHHQRLGPQQSDRFRSIADIIAAHPEQHGIDAFLDQRANHRGFDAGQVKLPSQCRHRPAAIGIGHGAQIIDDQLQLRVARAGVDQPVEEIGKSTHRRSTMAHRVPSR